MDPQSPAEWTALARQHEESARLLAENRAVAGQAYFHVGIAAECALKAYIMWRERLNSWPDKALRPELYTHDLRKLVRIAGIPVTPKDRLGPRLDPTPPDRFAGVAMTAAAPSERGMLNNLLRKIGRQTNFIAMTNPAFRLSPDRALPFRDSRSGESP